MPSGNSVSSAVLVAASQMVFTLDHGPVLASDLPALDGVKVLSYSFELCRYTACDATATLGVELPVVTVTAAGDDFKLVDGQPLRLADSTRISVSELDDSGRLFGVTVDEDDDGKMRVHLRDGLKGKSAPADMDTLPNEIAEGARTPIGIKSDREVSAVTEAAAAPTVNVQVDGPQNLIVWPDSEPVGLGTLVGE